MASCSRSRSTVVKICRPSCSSRWFRSGPPRPGGRARHVVRRLAEDVLDEYTSMGEPSAACACLAPIIPSSNIRRRT